MPAVLVEFPRQVSVVPPVVQGIEDRHAVDRQGDRPSKEGGFCGDRPGGQLGIQRDPPGVATGVRLRQRHLTLPGGDAFHHGMVGKGIRTDVKKFRVAAEFQFRLERLKVFLLHGDFLLRLGHGGDGREGPEHGHHMRRQGRQVRPAAKQHADENEEGENAKRHDRRHDRTGAGDHAHRRGGDHRFFFRRNVDLAEFAHPTTDPLPVAGAQTLKRHPNQFAVMFAQSNLSVAGKNERRFDLKQAVGILPHAQAGRVIMPRMGRRRQARQQQPRDHHGKSDVHHLPPALALAMQ